MAEADATQRASQGGGSRNPDPRADLLDVLIRGLEMARGGVDRGADAGDEALSLFCTYAYAEVGTLFCPFLYMHSVTRA
jgi:hypothetical protein